MSVTALACGFAIVVALALGARRGVGGPVLHRLRVLVPAWRFFDRASTSPELFVRAAGAAWTRVTPPPRGPLAWAFSPRGNLALAYHGAVERLVAEVAELDPATDHDAPAIVNLVSYALVSRVARAYAPAGVPWAWKITVEGDDYLCSPELGAVP